MATISIKAELTQEQIVEAIGQLGPAELDAVTRAALQSQSKQKAAERFTLESKLLDEIYAAKSSAFRRDLERSKKRRERRSLTEAEQVDYRRLADEAENANTRYVEALKQLADLRGITAAQLIDQLGLRTS